VSTAVYSLIELMLAECNPFSKFAQGQPEVADRLKPRARACRLVASRKKHFTPERIRVLLSGRAAGSAVQNIAKRENLCPANVIPCSNAAPGSAGCSHRWP
jgi:hypothetical protein